MNKLNKRRKCLKACLQWKVHLTYAASLQAHHADT